MNEKLLSMVDYVLQPVKIDNFKTIKQEYYDVIKYAKLLNTSLSLGQFIRCDLDGNVLIPPTGWGSGYNPDNPLPDEYMFEWKQYQEAEERCIFKEYKANIVSNEFIEIIYGNKYDIFTYSIHDCSFHNYWDKELETIEDLVWSNIELKQEKL